MHELPHINQCDVSCPLSRLASPLNSRPGAIVQIADVGLISATPRSLRAATRNWYLAPGLKPITQALVTLGTTPTLTKGPPRSLRPWMMYSSMGAPLEMGCRHASIAAADTERGLGGGSGLPRSQGGLRSGMGGFSPISPARAAPSKASSNTQRGVSLLAWDSACIVQLTEVCVGNHVIKVRPMDIAA